MSTQEFDARRTGPRYLTLGAALRRTVGARRGGRRRSVAQRDGRRRSIAASGESPEDGFFVGNGCGGEDGLSATGLQPAWRRQTCSACNTAVKLSHGRCARHCHCMPLAGTLSLVTLPRPARSTPVPVAAAVPAPAAAAAAVPVPVAVRALSPDGMSEAGKAVDGFCATTGAERATAVAAALRTDEKKRVATAGHQAPASPTRVAVVVLHSGRGAGSRVWAFGRARGALGVARTGLLALPGGKFSPRGRGDRDLRDAAVCELLEETGLAIGRGRVCPINLSPGFVAMLSCCEHCAADVVFSLFHVSLEDSEIPTIEGVTSNEHVTVTPLDVGAKPSALRAFLPHNHLMVLHWMHHMGGALRRLTAGEYPSVLSQKKSCCDADAPWFMCECECFDGWAPNGAACEGPHAGPPSEPSTPPGADHPCQLAASGFAHGSVALSERLFGARAVHARSRLRLRARDGLQAAIGRVPAQRGESHGPPW